MTSNGRLIETIRHEKPVPYQLAYEQQIQRRNRIESGDACNALILLEHTPTITLGRSGHTEHILLSEEGLATQGIDLVHVDRGGDVTYHGPGQLVAYPILNLPQWQRSVQWYLRTLEDIIINVLDHYGIQGERLKEFTGVWVDGAKVAAIGIGVHQWVSYHGISINLEPNLDHWNTIVPCGIPDKQITTLEKLLDSPPTMPELMDTFEDAFYRAFEGTPFTT
ncbi:MAG: lipoyl(octanoyl) transferase LipB [Candidatus Hydrogenedentota bacterium]